MTMKECKDRARAYLELGDATQCFTSFASDITKDEATNKPGIQLMVDIQLMEIMNGRATLQSTRKWLEGFAE